MVNAFYISVYNMLYKDNASNLIARANELITYEVCQFVIDSVSNSTGIIRARSQARQCLYICACVIIYTAGVSR